MLSSASIALYVAALLSAIAALLHFFCVYWGAEGYRFLGAGEDLAQKAAQGKWYPHAMAIIVGIMLSVCAAYAFTAAQGNILLPLSKWILSIISMALLLRALAFPLIKSHFKGNSDLFWYVSSTMCFILASLYGFGTYIKFYTL